METFLNEQSVREALGVGDIDFVSCRNSRWVDAMKCSGQKDFGTTKNVSLVVDGSEVGVMRSYRPLTFLKCHHHHHSHHPYHHSCLRHRPPLLFSALFSAATSYRPLPMFRLGHSLLPPCLVSPAPSIEKEESLRKGEIDGGSLGMIVAECQV
ncbi:hypothetical protein ACFE04_008070 [Oxalis oulophora]